MAFLGGMPGRIWNYLSPRKTQQRRDKPFKVPEVPVQKGLLPKTPLKGNVKEMSPGSRIKIWKIKSEPEYDAHMPPSPPMSAVQAPSLDFEGDTLVGSSPQQNPVDDKVDAWDANEGTKVVDDGQYMEIQKKANPDRERTRREEQGRELREAGWSEDAVFLFQKLGMRGFEPLFPMDWLDDFESLPADLFTYNINKAYIKSERNEDRRAQLALIDLLNVGSRARDAVIVRAKKRTAEYHIARAVQRYQRWAMRDANMSHVWNNLSLFSIVSCAKHVKPELAERKMIQQLGKLASLWRDAFRLRLSEDRNLGSDDEDNTLVHTDEDHQDAIGDYALPELPTLYGVITSHTVMAFVSYVPPMGPGHNASLRTVAMFDFSQEGYDVWNSLAVAIFVIHCRNQMMRLVDYLPHVVLSIEDDPDL